MPQLSSKLTTPAGNEAVAVTTAGHKIGGVVLQFPAVADMNTAITGETANIDLDDVGYSFCIWDQGTLIRISAEAPGVLRQWDREAATPNALTAVLPNASLITLAANTNTVLSTDGAPDAGDGADGDYAFDPSTSTLYGPKSTTWPSGTVLFSGTPPAGSVTNSMIAADAAIGWSKISKTGATKRDMSDYPGWPDGSEIVFDFSHDIASVTSNATKALSQITESPSFSHSWKVSTTAATGVISLDNTTKMKAFFGAETVDLSGDDDFGLLFYATNTGYWQVKLIFCSDAGGTFNNYYTLTLGNGGSGAAYIRQGWNFYHIKKDGTGVSGSSTGLATTGTPDWSNIQQFRINLTGNQSGTADYWLLQALVKNYRPRPQIILTYDDALGGDTYTNIRNTLNPKGLKANFHIIPEYVNVLTGYLTNAMCDTLQADGHLICGHHQTNLTTLTKAEAETAMRSVKGWLHHYGYAEDYFAWPNGAYDDELLEIADEIGLKITRKFNDVFIPPTRNWKYAMHEFKCIGANNGTHASGQALYDDVVTKAKLGRVVVVGQHGIGAGEGDDFDLERYEDWIDLLYADVQAGLVDVITWADFYHLQSPVVKEPEYLPARTQIRKSSGNLLNSYGLVSKTITSADVTLSRANTDASVISLSGALTGNRSLIIPVKTGKLLTIKNATTESYTVTVKASGQTGALATQGKTAQFYCDGTDWKRATADVDN